MEDIRNAKHWVANPPPEHVPIYVLDVKDNRGWQLLFPEEMLNKPPENLYWKTESSVESPRKEEFYWILSISGYGQVVFYGKEYEAEEEQRLWCRREGRVIPLRKADKDNPLDKKRVQNEIANVIEDIREGINGLYPLPAEGWV
jgi:hypothetical protein